MTMDPNRALESEEEVPRRYRLDDPPKACWELTDGSDSEMEGGPTIMGPKGLKCERMRGLAWKAVDWHNKKYGKKLKLGDVVRAYEFEKTYLVNSYYLAFGVEDENGNSKFVQAWVDNDGSTPDDLVPVYFAGRPLAGKRKKDKKGKSRVVVDSVGGSVRYVPGCSFTKKRKKGHSTATRQK